MRTRGLKYFNLPLSLKTAHRVPMRTRGLKYHFGFPPYVVERSRSYADARIEIHEKLKFR